MLLTSTPLQGPLTLCWSLTEAGLPGLPDISFLPGHRVTLPAFVVMSVEPALKEAEVLPASHPALRGWSRGHSALSLTQQLFSGAVCPASAIPGVLSPQIPGALFLQPESDARFLQLLRYSALLAHPEPVACKATVTLRVILY